MNRTRRATKGSRIFLKHECRSDSLPGGPADLPGSKRATGQVAVQSSVRTAVAG